MPNLIVLEDLSNRMRSFDLPHEVYCAAREECSCRISKDRRLWEDHKAGKRELRPNPTRICASITILARGYSNPLPEEVLLVPAIKSAIEREHSLRFAKYVEPEPEPTQASEPEPETESSSALPENTESNEGAAGSTKKTARKKATAKKKSASKTPLGGK